jgi:hypothetical protein
MTDEQRRQTGCTGVPKWEVILGWALGHGTLPRTLQSRGFWILFRVTVATVFFINKIGYQVVDVTIVR